MAVQRVGQVIEPAGNRMIANGLLALVNGNPFLVDAVARLDDKLTYLVNLAPLIRLSHDYVQISVLVLGETHTWILGYAHGKMVHDVYQWLVEVRPAFGIFLAVNLAVWVTVLATELTMRTLYYTSRWFVTTTAALIASFFFTTVEVMARTIYLLFRTSDYSLTFWSTFAGIPNIALWSLLVSINLQRMFAPAYDARSAFSKTWKIVYSFRIDTEVLKAVCSVRVDMEAIQNIVSKISAITVTPPSQALTEIFDPLHILCSGILIIMMLQRIFSQVHDASGLLLNNFLNIFPNLGKNIHTTFHHKFHGYLGTRVQSEYTASTAFVCPSKFGPSLPPIDTPALTAPTVLFIDSDVVSITAIPTITITSAAGTTSEVQDNFESSDNVATPASPIVPDDIAEGTVDETVAGIKDSHIQDEFTVEEEAISGDHGTVVSSNLRTAVVLYIKPANLATFISSPAHMPPAAGITETLTTINADSSPSAASQALTLSHPVVFGPHPLIEMKFPDSQRLGIAFRKLGIASRKVGGLKKNDIKRFLTYSTFPLSWRVQLDGATLEVIKMYFRSVSARPASSLLIKNCRKIEGERSDKKARDIHARPNHLVTAASSVTTDFKISKPLGIADNCNWDIEVAEEEERKVTNAKSTSPEPATEFNAGRLGTSLEDDENSATNTLEEEAESNAVDNSSESADTSGTDHLDNPIEGGKDGNANILEEFTAPDGQGNANAGDTSLEPTTEAHASQLDALLEDGKNSGTDNSEVFGVSRNKEETNAAESSAKPAGVSGIDHLDHPAESGKNSDANILEEFTAPNSQANANATENSPEESAGGSGINGASDSADAPEAGTKKKKRRRRKAHTYLSRQSQPNSTASSPATPSPATNVTARSTAGPRARRGAERAAEQHG